MYRGRSREKIKKRRWGKKKGRSREMLIGKSERKRRGDAGRKIRRE
jgi:hypothetical protein